MKYFNYKNDVVPKPFYFRMMKQLLLSFLQKILKLKEPVRVTEVIVTLVEMSEIMKKLQDQLKLVVVKRHW